MNFTIQRIEAQNEIGTLNWFGDRLVDLASGGRSYGLDGSITSSALCWGGPPFDLCVVSHSGRYAALCQRLGTKGLIIELGADRPKILREVNRSYYCSGVYEYPIAFMMHDGVERLVHCPQEYCQIEIEDIRSGKSVLNLELASKRKPADIFHSRLGSSPSGSKLLSAGWVWHPFDTLAFFDLTSAVSDPLLLDQVACPGLENWGEVSSAAFVDEDTILVSENSTKVTYGDGEKSASAKIRMISLKDQKLIHEFELDLAAGTMMALDSEHVVTFYGHPKVFHIPTGRLIASWPEINSGKDSSSIIHHLDKSPAMAFDPKNKRFAVACGKEIVVIKAGAV